MTTVTLTEPRRADPAPRDPLLDALRLAYQRAQSLYVRAYGPHKGPGTRFPALLSLIEALGELEGLTAGRVCSGAAKDANECLNLIRLGNLFRSVAYKAKADAVIERWSQK